MKEKEIKTASKFLSLILRHQPDTIGLELDKNGWASVEELIEKANINGHSFSRELIETVVSTNDKKRFAFNEDRARIRASQGHSLKVELDLQIQEPPEHLYHGTISENIKDIKSSGLKKMSRQHVHLSKDEETARKVGSRRGKPVILIVKALEMYKTGSVFYISENGVWLTDEVPQQYIIF